MNFREIGFFKEFSYGNVECGSIYDELFKFNRENKDNIIKYLKSGIVVAVAPGISRDFVSGKKEIIGGLSILTDGTFLWSSDFFYYFSKYNISIPDIFYYHMQKNNWQVPKVENSN